MQLPLLILLTRMLLRCCVSFGKRLQLRCCSAMSALPPLKAAVIVPGLLSDDKDFIDMAKELTARGLPTAVVPMPVWAWIPQLGGRSVRPILERIDHTVRHVAAMADAESAATSGMLPVPRPGYSIHDRSFESCMCAGKVQEKRVRYHCIQGC